MRKLKTYLITGIAALLPLVASFYVLTYIFKILDGMSGSLITFLLGRRIPGLGLILTVLIVILTGILATNIIGKKLIIYGERIMYRIPIVKSIYKTVKQIVDAFYQGEKRSFKQVALVEYPRRGIYSLGFITGDTEGEAQYKTHEKLVNIFIPTTPNPTSGYLLLVPKEDIILMEMSVEEAIKMIISGGVVTPPYNPVTKTSSISDNGQPVLK